MSISKLSFLFLLMTSLLFQGCAPKQDLYYWGEYSDSLYDLKKNPCEESIASHMAALEHVVEESKNRNLRIPPGVCAELGYFYARKNDKNQATALFLMEKEYVCLHQPHAPVEEAIRHAETRGPLLSLSPLSPLTAG